MAELNKPIIMLQALMEGRAVKVMMGETQMEISLGENSRGRTVTGVPAQNSDEEVLLIVDLSLGDFIDIANKMSDDDALIMSANTVLNSLQRRS